MSTTTSTGSRQVPAVAHNPAQHLQRAKFALLIELQSLAVRRAERREVRAWLRQHPPSLGRGTGCRAEEARANRR